MDQRQKIRENIARLKRERTAIENSAGFEEGIEDYNKNQSLINRKTRSINRLNKRLENVSTLAANNIAKAADNQKASGRLTQDQ